jgi:nucleoid DNA-binding protein
MVEEKLKVMKEELEAIIEKENALTGALRQAQELKLKYIGGIEVLQQLEEEGKKPEDKKKK